MKTRLFNIPIDVLSNREALHTFRQFIVGDRCHTACFLNAHCFNVAQKDDIYRAVLDQADLVLNDGVGLDLVARAAGVKLKENLNGTDLIPKIISLAAELKAPVYFLGGREYVAELAARNIESAYYPGLVAGYRSGYFDVDEENEILDAIRSSGAQVLILGMGVPRQELWAARNQAGIAGIRLIVSGGAIIDFLSGEIPRAPLWMRRLRLEWLFRLGLEPARMWRRYIAGSFVLLANVIRLRFT